LKELEAASPKELPVQAGVVQMTRALQASDVEVETVA
jgi:hypothetical protein